MLNKPFVLYLGALRKWRLERGWDPGDSGKRLISVEACEHIVVFNKRDLVPQWGIEVSLTVDIIVSKEFSPSLMHPIIPSRIIGSIQPFRKAMAKKFPHQRLLFASWHRPRDIRNLSEILVSRLKVPSLLRLCMLIRILFYDPA